MRFQIGTPSGPLEVLFPYDYIYPEQHEYMVTLARLRLFAACLVYPPLTSVVGILAVFRVWKKEIGTAYWKCPRVQERLLPF